MTDTEPTAAAAPPQGTSTTASSGGPAFGAPHADSGPVSGSGLRDEYPPLSAPLRARGVGGLRAANPEPPDYGALDPPLARLLTVIHCIPLGIAVTTPGGIIEYFNPSLSAATGLDARQAVGSDLHAIRLADEAGSMHRIRSTLLAGECWQGEVGLRKVTGEVLHAAELVCPTLGPDGTAAGFVHFVQDIRDQKWAESLRRLAFYDSLTGLPNRNLIEDRLTMAVAAARRSGSSFALLCIDLDRFKQINDTRGHETGDRLLRAVAGRLRAALRATDTVGRWGGDEFVAIVECAGPPEALARITEKLLATGAAPYRIAGREYRITLSVGASLYPQHTRDGEGLFAAADAAMYRAKAAGGNTCRIAPQPLKITPRRSWE